MNRLSGPVLRPLGLIETGILAIVLIDYASAQA